MKAGPTSRTQNHEARRECILPLSHRISFFILVSNHNIQEVTLRKVSRVQYSKSREHEIPKKDSRPATLQLDQVPHPKHLRLIDVSRLLHFAGVQTFDTSYLPERVDRG